MVFETFESEENQHRIWVLKMSMLRTMKELKYEVIWI